MANTKDIVYGLYNDEEDLLRAVKVARDQHLEIMDVYTPFPVHGLDPLLGLSESRLHIAGFVYGAIGTLTAFIGMSWMMAKDWPITIGGKPHWAIPAFIPITFEVTVLFASIGMVVSFYIINGLGPGVVNPTIDLRITDDKFCIAFDKSETDAAKAEAFLRSTGAAEVNAKTI